jgi:hypothetical protein
VGSRSSASPMASISTEDGTVSAPAEGGSVGDAYAAETEMPDSSANVSSDVVTGPAICPTECNSGCDGGTCFITIMNAAGPVKQVKIAAP